MSAIVGADARGARPPLFWLLLPFAAGYGVSYFFRTVNAVAGPTLATEFDLGPDRLGFLTSAYFLAFSLAQIPLGIALDRFGPARVNIAMVLSAALGALVFGCSDTVWELALGRALIGLGAGAALMSSMSAVHLWAGRERAATTIGFIMTLGGVGAIVASTPTQWVIDRAGWRMVFLMLSALCCLIAMSMLGTLKASRPAAAGESLGQLLGGVARVYADRMFWRVCIPHMLILGTMLAFQSLWAATWMRDVAGYTDRIAIGNVLVAFNLGMTGAFLCAGWIGDALRARGIGHLATLKAYMGIALLAQVWLMALPTVLPHLAWSAFSFGANALLLGYPLLAARFPPELTGRVNTSVNLLAFSAAFFLQAGIGVVVNLWPASAQGYAPQGYYAAWIVLACLQAAGLAWLVLAPRRIVDP